MSEDQVAPEKKFLDAIDYTIFIGMLVISVAIGLYFAILNKRKPNTAVEYLTGSKELSIFPVAMSLFSSQLSGFIFLAYPAEVYMYGSQTLLHNFFGPFIIVIVFNVFMPVFYHLNILSSYEYLTKRFNYKIGMLASVMYLIKTLGYSAGVIYIPSIALSQLTGIKIEILIPILSITCIFYTSIGGLRAIVWADTLQAMFMFFGTFALAIIGTYHVGGFKNVWNRNEDSGRIEFFNMDPDPRTRTTFWTAAIGMFISGMGETTVNQLIVQRCMALSTFHKVKITALIFTISGMAVVIVNGFNGLVAFAIFYDCDPVTTKTVARADQIIPYLWMFLTREIPALPGLFVSALFSASFSTMSTTLNCMAGVFVIDIVKPLCKRPITEAKATFLMKMMVFIFGCLVLGFAFVIDKMGGLFQVALSFSSLVSGPLFGAFILGMFCPRVNANAVLVASLSGFSLITWIFIGAQVAVSRNQMIYPKKNFSIDGCDNSTLEAYYSGLLHETKNNFTTVRTEPFPLYAISYQYYSLIGSLTTVAVGLIVSYFTGDNDKSRMNVNLYSPIIRKWIRTECTEAEEMQLNNTD